MKRICATCLKEKVPVKGTFQQVCITPECIVAMVEAFVRAMERDL